MDMTLDSTETIKIYSDRIDVRDYYCEDFTNFMSIEDIKRKVMYDPVIKEIVKPLGRGAYGLVAEVIAVLPYINGQTFEGRFAAKFLAPSYRNTQAISELPLKERLIAQSVLKHRFYEEFSAMYNLGNHEGVVAAYRPGDFNNVQYFIMELVEGGNLHDLMFVDNPEEKISVNDFTKVMLQVANLLDYVHEYGVHRDLKPPNILIDGNDKVKLTDYGLVQRLNHPFLRDIFKSIDGTPSYMSPEQIRGDEIDTKTDLWAMGVMIYEFLTGSVPMAEFNTYEFFGTDVYSNIEYTPIPKASGKKYEALRKLAKKLMKLDKEERPKNSRQVASELEKILKMSNGLILRSK